MSDVPTCGAQKPSDVPSPFDWWLFAAIAAAGGALPFIYTSGVPIANSLIIAISGSGPLLPGAGIVASAAGAAAILILIGYFAFQADGCIVPKPKTQPVCCSGIVEQTFDLWSVAVLILAPYAVGPAGAFDVVVKGVYWPLVTKDAYWVLCSGKGAAMLRCIVQSSVSCGARVGSLVGGVLAAIPAIALGYLAGAAIASAGCGFLAPICFLIALIVAAIVAAIIVAVVAIIGGLIGAGIASAADDPVGDAWEGLEAGTIVTVRGDWVTDPDIGYNKLFYVTQLNRTGSFATPPSYTTADADSTAADDCPLVPPEPEPPK